MNFLIIHCIAIFGVIKGRQRASVNTEFQVSTDLPILLNCKQVAKRRTRRWAVHSLTCRFLTVAASTLTS